MKSISEDYYSIINEEEIEKYEKDLFILLTIIKEVFETNSFDNTSIAKVNYICKERDLCSLFLLENNRSCT